MEALKLQNTYPFNPMKPTGTIARLLRATRDNLPKEFREQVGVFCTLWTIADYVFGIDGAIAHQKNLWHPVTFDLSLYNKPESRLRADLLVTKENIWCRQDLARIGEKAANLVVNSLREKKRWKSRKRRPTTFADRHELMRMLRC